MARDKGAQIASSQRFGCFSPLPSTPTLRQRMSHHVVEQAADHRVLAVALQQRHHRLHAVVRQKLTHHAFAGQQNPRHVQGQNRRGSQHAQNCLAHLALQIVHGHIVNVAGRTRTGKLRALCAVRLTTVVQNEERHAPQKEKRVIVDELCRTYVFFPVQSYSD